MPVARRRLRTDGGIFVQHFLNVGRMSGDQLLQRHERALQAQLIRSRLVDQRGHERVGHIAHQQKIRALGLYLIRNDDEIQLYIGFLCQCEKPFALVRVAITAHGGYSHCVFHRIFGAQAIFFRESARREAKQQYQCQQDTHSPFHVFVSSFFICTRDHAEYAQPFTEPTIMPLTR